MVFSLFQLRGRFLHRGRLRAGVAAPHPVFGKKSWDCFFFNLGRGAARGGEIFYSCEVGRR